MTVQAIVLSSSYKHDISGWGGYGLYVNEVVEILNHHQPKSEIARLIRNGKKIVETLEKQKSFNTHSLQSLRLNVLRKYKPDRLQEEYSSILECFNPEKPTVIWHQLNNYHLPGLNFFKLAKIANIIVVTTCHDVQDKLYPENFSHKELEYRNESYKFNLMKATRVLASTNQGKNELIEHLNLDEDKILVIPHGIDRSINENINRNALRNSTDKIKNLFVYPARSWPNKNHINFIKEVLGREHVNFVVILLGNLSSIENEINAFKKNVKFQERFLLLGFVDVAIRNRVFAEASAFVFPSSYEGFGYPYLEAAVLKKEILGFQIPVLTELLGPQTNCVINHDFEALVDKMQNFRVSDSVELETNYLKAIMFDWEKTARAYFECYQKVILNAPSPRN